MGIIKEYLKNRGYNLRERLNIYAGTFLGVAIPITAARYLIFPSRIEDLTAEIISWVYSAAYNVALYPISTTIIVSGVMLGNHCAKNLRNKRGDKKSNLEKSFK